MKIKDRTVKVSKRTYEMLVHIKNARGSSHKWIIEDALTKYIRTIDDGK